MVAGHALLGACWLIAKTEGRAHDHAIVLARRFGMVTLAVIVAVSAATSFLSHGYADRWLTFPGVLVAAPVPILVGISALLFWRALGRQANHAPFALALVIFAFSFMGLGISLYPFIIPPDVTIWAAAAPADSQGFMLVGAGIMLPVIMGYTGGAYWVFRGKVGKGYH